MVARLAILLLAAAVTARASVWSVTNNVASIATENVSAAAGDVRLTVAARSGGLPVDLTNMTSQWWIVDARDLEPVTNAPGRTLDATAGVVRFSVTLPVGSYLASASVFPPVDPSFLVASTLLTVTSALPFEVQFVTYTNTGGGGAGTLSGAVSTSALLTATVVDTNVVVGLSAAVATTDQVAEVAANLATNVQASALVPGGVLPALDGSALTNLSVSAPAGLITNQQTGVTLAGSFSGDGAGITNAAQSDTNAFAWIAANGMARTSNTTMSANTLLTMQRGAATQLTVTTGAGGGPAPGIVVQGSSGGGPQSISLSTTNGNYNSPIPMLRLSNGPAGYASHRFLDAYQGSTPGFAMISEGRSFALTTGRDARSTANGVVAWGNTVDSGAPGMGLVMATGNAGVMLALGSVDASSTTDYGLLNIVGDLNYGGASYSNTYFDVNRGGRLRWFRVRTRTANAYQLEMDLTNRVTILSSSNFLLRATGVGQANTFGSMLHVVGTSTRSTNFVWSGTTNLVDITYTNNTPFAVRIDATVTLTNDGSGYAEAGFEVGGVVHSQASMSQSGTNRMMIGGWVSTGQTWSVTNTSVGGSVGLSLLTQGR